MVIVRHVSCRLERVGRQQAAVFAEGTEEHAVEDPLRESDERGPGHARIVGHEPAKHIEPHAGIGIVERSRELAAHPLRLGQQSRQMADA